MLLVLPGAKHFPDQIEKPLHGAFKGNDLRSVIKLSNQRDISQHREARWWVYIQNGNAQITQTSKYNEELCGAARVPAIGSVQCKFE
jgi:hypothetical protein